MAHTLRRDAPPRFQLEYIVNMQAIEGSANNAARVKQWNAIKEWIDANALNDYVLDMIETLSDSNDSAMVAIMSRAVRTRPSPS